MVIFKGRLFGAGSIAVRARGLTSLEALPGSAGAFWSAKVARAERHRARELALVAEAELKRARVAD